MKFQSDTNIAYQCINKYKRTAYLYFPLFLLLSVIISLMSYHEYHNINYLIFAIVAEIFLFYRFLIVALRKGLFLINRLVDNIIINENEIRLQTYSVEMFLQLFKRESLTVVANRNQIKIELSRMSFVFDPKYTKNLYILIYAGEKYLLAENFFDQFQEIKTELGISE